MPIRQNLMHCLFPALVGITLLGTSLTEADTGDVIDDALPEATNVTWCATADGNEAGAVWADVDEDGTYDTQVVLTTLTGEAAIEPEFTSGKWYFHSFIDVHCGGASPYHQRGRFRIHFVDILAPGFVWNDPTTWVFKAVPALSIRLSNDGCYSYTDPRYTDPAIHPVHTAHAYRELGQTDLLAMAEGIGVHNFADPGGTGIKELNITTDFCESILNDLILCSDAASPNCGGAPPAEPGVALAFDVSGSMGWAHDGTVGVPAAEQRLTFAKAAANAFLTAMNDLGSGVASFGISGFPNHPQVGCSAEVISPMTLVNDANIANAITTTVPGLNAQGSTPLLAGLGTSIGMFTSEHPRTVVLLSDGYHNCPNTVTVSDPAVLTAINNAVAASTTVYTIGFGRPTDIDHPLLDALANETHGDFHDVTGPTFDPATWDPATALAKAYTDILADALDLETGLDPLAVLDPGKSLVKELAVNEHDSKVSVIVTWRTQRRDQVRVTLRSSDGVDVSPSGSGVRYHQGATYTVWTIDKTFLAVPGKVGPKPWQLELHGPRDGAPEPVHYTVLMDSELKLESDFGEARLATGVKPRVTARLSAADRPVLGAKVQLTMARPNGSAGTWLAQKSVERKALDAMTPDKRADGISPLTRKLRWLVDKQGVQLPKLETQRVPLRDDGTHGDAKAGDGVYTAVIDALRFDGRYAFHFAAEGETAGGNPFRREARVHRWIAGHPSAKTTSIEIRRIVGQKPAQLAVRVVPRDLYGNYLGPNLGGFIRVEPHWGRRRGEIIDNLDGSYTQILEIPTTLNEDVPLTVTVRGVKMESIWRPGSKPRPDLRPPAHGGSISMPGRQVVK